MCRSAAHCFCSELGSPYCKKEVVQQKKHLYSIFVGLKDKSRPEEAMKYEIESVTTPRGRIELYKAGRTAGPYDIVLIKTTTNIVFNNNIMPVMIYCFKNAPKVISSFLQVCLDDSIKDTGTLSQVDGFGALSSSDYNTGSALCWTDENGPQIFKGCESECKKEPPPMDPVCNQFFEMNDQAEEVVEISMNGNKHVCLKNLEVVGDNGWCQV